MKTKNDQQFAFRVPSEVWNAVLKRADEEALTPSAILRQLLIKAVREWGERKETNLPEGKNEQ